MKRNIILKTVIAIMLGGMLVNLLAETYAQQRVKRKSKKVVVRTPVRPAPKIVKLPVGHKTVRVGRVSYYYHSGIFYKKSPKGYIVARAPIGARVAVLPRGYVTLHVGAGIFYSYYGTYYRFDPVKKVYIVVDKPVDIEEEVYDDTLDNIKLIDGKILTGVYLGGTGSIVQFEVDGELLEISVQEIVSITFASS